MRNDCVSFHFSPLTMVTVTAQLDSSHVQHVPDLYTQGA